MTALAKLSAALLGLCVPLVLTAQNLQTAPYPAPANETPEYWFNSGRQALEQALALQPNTRRARNIVLIVGDGMGISTITASRIFAGQMQGNSGEEHQLSFETFPYVALSKTYNTNQQTPDSAGTMTAMMSGIKTRAGLIGVNQHVNRADCASSMGNEVPTLMQQAAARGMATGFVTTTRVTHATPAATYAHSAERDWESDADLSDEARRNGCADIAAQLIDFDFGAGINVAMGGGLQAFLPASETSPLNQRPGARLDGRNLTQEWQDRYPDSAFIWNRQQLAELDLQSTSHLLGLFNGSQMSYAHDRTAAGGEAPDITEPSLPEMARAALTILQQQGAENGYFLMLEAGRIDHAHHAGNAYRALYDTQELSEAVAVVQEMTDASDTLVIVTADHSHSLTIGGYSTRGNPILGLALGNDDHGHADEQPRIADDNMPYTTLGYRDGLGFAEASGGDRRYGIPAAPGRHNLDQLDTTHPDFHQEVLVPLESEGHAGEDVAIYANGPWAHLFHGAHEQHYIYHVMRHALGW